MEEEKLYFTEITENEKRVINLIRTYIAPYGTVAGYVDFLVDDLVHKLIDKTVRLKAFIEVMQHERDNKEVTDIEMLNRLNQFEDYISGDEDIMHKYINNIFTDILDNLEGDIKSIDVYKEEKKKQVEETLDKINHS